MGITVKAPPVFRAGIIWGLIFCMVFGAVGCQSLSRLGEERPEEGAVKPSKSEAFYHYLKAQQFLLADDGENAAKEYEEALKYDPESARLETEAAALCQRLGDVKKALIHVTRALKINPRDQDALFIMAGLHVGLNQLREATQEYERILVLDPENREARLFLATLYAQQRRYHKAIRMIHELLRQRPKMLVGYYYLGRIYLEMDQLGEAKKELQRVLSLDPNFVPAMFDMGTALEREKRYKLAMAFYRRILKAQPKNAKVWTSIGRLYLLMGRRAEAHKAFKHAKGLEKNEAPAIINIGLSYLELKYPDDALREFRLLMDNPRYKERARYYIGLALEEKGDLAAAGREYQLVSRDSEDFLPARLRLAYIYFQQKKRDQAFQLMKDLLAIAPGREDVYLTLAYFYEDENRWDRAIDVLKAGLEKLKNSEEINFRLAVIYDKKKDLDNSILYIKKVLELDPENPDAKNFLGYTYADAGIHLDEAERLIREALRAKPDSGHIVDSLGWVFYKKGQYDKALPVLERAARMMPNDGTVAEHLGDAYVRTKHYSEALKTYRRALGLENANIKQLRDKIKYMHTHPKEFGK